MNSSAPSDTTKLLEPNIEAPPPTPPRSPCACRNMGRHRHHTSPQRSNDHENKTKLRCFHLPSIPMDHDAMQFGARMAVCLSVSSMFVLAQLPTEQDRFPEGMWVLITVLFVCWFPTLDAASVLEKSIQRLFGTFIGAGLGLISGFLSLYVAKECGYRAQAIFLGSCIALVSFVVCSYAVNRKVGGGARLIERKNYATILCLLTFTICLMPFYSIDDNGKQWQKSIYRIMNVIIGCFLGVGLSMLVFPRPTVCILQDKITKQIELAGEAAEAVLHTAADIFSEKAFVPASFAEEILGPPDLCRSIRQRTPSVKRKWKSVNSDLGYDVVLEKYEAASKEYRAAKSQLGMLRYDPFNIGRPNDLLEKFRSEVANTLARSMRIQTTVVLIDGIVRNDPKHRFSSKQIELLAHTGSLIRSMLSVPLDMKTSDIAARELSTNLVAMRKMIVDLSATVSSSPGIQIPSVMPDCTLDNNIKKSSIDLAGMYGSSYHSTGSLQSYGEKPQLDMCDKGGQTAPKHVHGSHVCSLLFLQLAEHLALRSVRLYQSWKQCEGVCETAEHLRASVRENMETLE